MAVSRSRKTQASDSPPTTKRPKIHYKQVKHLVCFDPNKSTSIKPNKTIVKRLYSDCSSAVKRANQVQENLSPEFPSFVKNMLRSHVVQGFWMGLPKKFCHSHLPKHDSTMMLEDEEGVEWETKYLAAKDGLSAGWRGFSTAHKIAVGDVVVFQLVSPFKFKVYIVRLNGSDSVDCALGLLELEACSVEKLDPRDLVSYDDEEEEEEDDETLESFLKNLKNSNTTSDRSEVGPAEVSDGIRLSESNSALEYVQGVEDFEILANGLIINSEIPKHSRGKYLELCRARGRLLHGSLIEGLNCKLVAGVISETVNVADAIRTSHFATAVAGDLSLWDRSLGAFQVLGMDVGFLRARLGQLVELSSESRRCERVTAERDLAVEELRVLEEKVVAARERATRLDAELERLGPDYGRGLEVVFKEVASAPW